mmetsp:Transcript_12319/g.20403  ORF Transcript_12319/g.20403 Transcript_12319/m.20403 type:complete len:272 (+) Transcript_12319:2337-3152(+)
MKSRSTEFSTSRIVISHTFGIEPIKSSVNISKNCLDVSDRDALAPSERKPEILGTSMLLALTNNCVILIAWNLDTKHGRILFSCSMDPTFISPSLFQSTARRKDAFTLTSFNWNDNVVLSGELSWKSISMSSSSRRVANLIRFIIVCDPIMSKMSASSIVSRPKTRIRAILAPISAVSPSPKSNPFIFTSKDPPSSSRFRTKMLAPRSISPVTSSSIISPACVRASSRAETAHSPSEFPRLFQSISLLPSSSGAISSSPDSGSVGSADRNR